MINRFDATSASGLASSAQSILSITRALFFAMMVASLVVLAGCDLEFDDDSCRDAQSCTWGCPAGGCNWLCTDEASCDADCQGGDCRLTCDAEADCIFDCPGGGCQFTCRGDASCDLFCPTQDCNYSCDPSATCL